MPVLCFHQVRQWRPTDSATARAFITPPRLLAEQLAALAQAGYATVTPDQLVSFLEYGAPLPPRPVMLSFDDGSQGHYTDALPLLLRHHFVATFFVMTVVLDKPTWLARAQVRDLRARGMTIGAHTYDHHSVTRLSGSERHTQLVQPARELARLTGGPIRHLAYPYGTWNRAALPQVHAAGYHAAFQLTDRQDPDRPLLTLRRMIAPSEGDGATLIRAIRTAF